MAAKGGGRVVHKNTQSLCYMLYLFLLSFLPNPTHSLTPVLPIFSFLLAKLLCHSPSMPTHDSMPLNHYVFPCMDFPYPQVPSQGASLVQDWEKETFGTLLLYYLTITEKDGIMVKHWLEGEGGAQVPAWVKPCIHPVPFFPDVVLRVCNITLSCVTLSTLLQRTVGEFICPYPRSWQK